MGTLAQRKHHARKWVSSSDLEDPLVHDRLKKPSEVHLKLYYHRCHQNCTILCDCIIFSSGGNALADYQPQKLCREGQVSLLNGSLWLKYPFNSLSIN